MYKIKKTQPTKRGNMQNLEGGGKRMFRIAICDDEKIFNEFKKKAHDQLSVDGGGHLTYLAPSRVNLQLMQERWPDIQFRNTREH